MFKSLHNRLLVWFLAFSLLMISIIIPYNYFHFKKKAKINEIIGELKILENSLLRRLKIQNDFFSYESINPEYFQTGKSEYLKMIRENHELSVSIIDNIASKVKVMNFDLPEEDLEKLGVNFSKQHKIFNDMVDKLFERGFKDYGTEGKMRNNVHKLEEFVEIDQTKVLSLRRHEKDYIIRKNDQYIRKLNNLVTSFSNDIRRKKKIDQERKILIIRYLDQYAWYFNKLVELETILGLKDNSGLKKELDQLSLQVMNEIKSGILQAEQVKAIMFKRLEIVYVIISFFLIVLSIISSFLVSKKITRPFKLLSLHLRSLVENNFIYSRRLVPSKNNIKEVKLFYDDFNTMLETIVKNEKERDKALLALRESELKYRETSDLMPISLIETNRDDMIIYANKAWRENFGYRDGKITVHLKDIFEIGFATNPDEGLIINKEYTLVRKNKTKFPALVYCNKINKDNEFRGRRIVLIDISARKKYLKELEAAKRKAEESDNLKSAFLANMSHEIRTPLNAILGFSSILAEEEFSNKKSRKYIDYIQEGGKNLLKIIDDIIDIAKIESGQTGIHNGTFNLNEVLTELYYIGKENLKRYKKKRVKLMLIKEKPNEEAFIETDKERLKQVINNLVTNSVKYTEEGIVEFGYNIVKDKILFYVKDTGIGIPISKHKFVFNRFMKIENDTNLKNIGAGLGLAISRNLVELMGGRIWFDSEEDRGATFYVELPYKSIGLEEKQLTALVSEEFAHMNNYKVLIVEDNHSSYIFLKEVLKKINIETIHAKNGKEAIEMARSQESIDMILMDIQMPIMDGYEATRKIRQFDKEILIIAQSAYAMHEEKNKGLEAGCDDYVTKPINVNELKEKISYHLRQKVKVVHEK